jgi:hypothetical protein
MLDVVGNSEASRKNYEKMLSYGLNPMFVATMFDKNFDYIRSAVANNENICVAGGATTKGDWMTNRFLEVYRETEQKAKIHGLAYVTFPKMLQLPLASVDSATWRLGPQSFGQIRYFDRKVNVFYYKNILNGKRKLKPKEVQLFHNLGITPEDFLDRSNHRRSTSIGLFSTIKAYIDMQKYCKRRNLKLFLAINQVKDLEQILYVATSKNPTYKDFKTL